MCTKYKGPVPSQYYFFGLRSRLHYLVERFMKQIATQLKRQLHCSWGKEKKKEDFGNRWEHGMLPALFLIALEFSRFQEYILSGMSGA